jgi:3-deoxy-D-arabino-heptulosonate 7-phosphate (DAHP) synthase class II
MKEIISNGSISDHEKAAALVEALPVLAVDRNYNFPYPQDRANDVVDTMALLQTMRGVTTLDNVKRYRGLMAGVGSGAVRRPVLMTKSCHEDVRPLAVLEGEEIKYTPADILSSMVQETDIIRSAVLSSDLRGAIQQHRDRGQYFKPRSQGFQEINVDGKTISVPSFGGHGVNHEDPAKRTPNPIRAAEAAIQSGDFEDALTERFGTHLWAAHEALSLLYEAGFLRVDLDTDQMFSVSADLLWLGDRTKHPLGDQAEILKRLMNVTGSKLGPDSTRDLIAETEQEFNPNGLPGKHVYMIRVSNEDSDALDEIAAGIAENASNAVVLNDVHGITRNEGEWKIRSVDAYDKNTEMVSKALNKRGLVLHGHALETVSDDDRLEWVDHDGEEPTHTGNIDPRANPRQTREIANRTAKYLL